MSSSRNHDQLRDQILLAVSQSRLAIVWNNETGLVRSYDDASRTFFTGLVGSPDIIGITVGGYWLGIEVKSGRGQLRNSQINFRNMVEKLNGIFIVGRTTQQVLEEIRTALKCKTSLSDSQQKVT